MEQKENILSEIRAVAPLLADVGNSMPFGVPEAYFELFPVQILAKVAAPFQQPSVPTGYFDAMPAIMLAKVKALENANELEAVAPTLMGISRQMPYSVPAGYFENLGATREDVASVTANGPHELATVAPALIGISREMPYNVPAGYFESLQANHEAVGFVATIGSDELGAVAPALMDISRQMPYSLPAGYFENLQAGPVQAPAPVVPIRSKLSVLKWAVAASVVVLAGLFAWQFLNTTTVQNNPVTANAATVDSASSAELATALAGLEDTSLDTELDDAGMPKDTRSALYYLETENFETALRDFSDEEIKTQLADQATMVKSKT